MRHGPHHGAQKSTTTGTADALIAASNAGASATSRGSAGAPSVVWHLPQRVSAFSFANARRLRWPHDGHCTIAPLLSRFSAMSTYLRNQCHETAPVLGGIRVALD